ncbi:GSCOCG00002776001-RA-CDS [Cotesia congregata]|uniref:Cytochrome c oxidase assembly factor 3 n=1 Tax=Cotesia congregata TaxID=51543 RepID=A0A8J2HG61_COTCN|nr:GSCOCG00002776001-RA-CDS [Cotesia congregata]CAG5097749.1 Similar to Ccdc56: Cytochrome c oxidase assembly factor 3 [Cotesia congregata]
MDKEEMPPVDFDKEKKLSSLQRHLAKRIHELNLKRAVRMIEIRKTNRWMATGLFAGVFGIYFYTIHAVKQEKFLDDFELPETVSTEQA